jgi:DNA-binding NarL/FixJ family response regulator
MTQTSADKPLPPPDAITVLIVDDHFVVRSGLVTALELETDIRVVAEAENTTEALAAYQAHRPRVVLMDLQLAEDRGIAATAAIRAFDAQARVLIFSNFSRIDELQSALNAGALGFVPKSASRTDLLAALRVVARGGRSLPSDIAHRLNEVRLGPVITAREREVLTQIAAGLANKEIAQKLNISEFTVKRHVGQILDKMGVNDRAQAAVEAIRRGLLDLPK